MYDGTWHVSNIVHDVYYNHIWHIVGRRITQNGLLRQLPGWNWTFKSGSPAKCNDENYQHVVRHYCWQVWWSRHIISTQNFSKFVSTKNRPRLIKVKDNLDFNDFFRWSGGRPNGFFSRIKRHLMQFINYVLRVHSVQQLFIWAPTLLRRFPHTYIYLDMYSKTLGVTIIEV